MLEIEGISLYIVLGVFLVLLLWIGRLEWRINRLLGGKKARSLEAAILETNEQIAEFQVHKKEVARELETIHERLHKSVQAVKTIRFNPFADKGSNQSFTTAIVTGKGDGVIISSLNSRDRVAVYAKPLQGFSSEYELSDEEKEALKRAQEIF